MKIALVALLLLTACDRQPEWRGWVYPDRNNLADDITIGAFDTLGQCGASAKAIIVRLEESRDESGVPVRADYECGYKCKSAAGLSGNVCEQTSR